MLSYEREWSFFERILRQFHLPLIRVKQDMPLFPQADQGLRLALGMDLDERPWERYLRQHLKGNTIYRVIDDFACSYILFRLPECPEPSLVLVGPYSAQEHDSQWLNRFCEENGIRSQWVPILEEYYRKVPYVKSSELLYAALNALGESMWGVQNFSSEDMVNGIPDSLLPLSTMPEAHGRENFISDVRTVEARYEAENRLMQAVAQGRTHRALTMLASFSQSALESRTQELSRNTQNYSIILNTVLRKAAEQGGVHPLYIDRLSSEFAHRIEETSNASDFETLWQEMAHKYCLLVKKHSSQNHSQLVQQVISRVDYDLGADLSLKANAEALNVNASYLSSLFRKEMGVTLTDYVNRKRVEHAMYLLSNTTLSISSVGQYCGIQDDNYFTKMFKKYTGKTPKQFRQENVRFPKA